MTTENRNIVFLGASYAGLSGSHYFLKHIYPQLPTHPQVKYQVIIVDPSSKFYHRNTSPRAVVETSLAPVDKIFIDREPAFAQYGDAVRLIQAKATSWDISERTVTLQSTDGKTQTLPYWALVLATGSRTDSPVFSMQGPAHDVSKTLSSVHSQIQKAKSIVISGGGPASVETAGELGEALNGVAGWFSSWPKDPKVDITVITSASKLLPALRMSIAEQAETYLNRVGVKVRYNTKIYSSKQNPNGKTTVVLHDGEQIETDLYIPGTGVHPVSDYAPEHLKNSKGYIIQNNATLRVDAAGPRVYAIGDVGTYSDNSMYAILQGVPVFGSNIKSDLLAAHSASNSQPEKPDREYVPYAKEMQIVPVGRSKGVGAIFGWRIPSWMVWMIKGREYMVSKTPGIVDGSAFWSKES